MKSAKTFPALLLVLSVFIQPPVKAASSIFQKEVTLDLCSAPFGIEICGLGSWTWKTKVELIVQKTLLAIGEVTSFTILGNITNTSTGIGNASNVATVFGKQDDISEFDVLKAQPFESFIEATDPKILVGPSNPWAIRAFDQVSSGSSSFSGTIGGVGATYASTVQGPTVSDWFEPIGISNKQVRIENRVLSSSNHGLFTGSGSSFKIDGFLQDTAIGVGNIAFKSRANYTVYGPLSPTFSKYQILDFDVISLTVPVESRVLPPVPGPLPLLGVGAAYGYSRKLRKRIKNSQKPEVMSAIG